jgi:hypothetical protein
MVGRTLVVLHSVMTNAGAADVNLAVSGVDNAMAFGVDEDQFGISEFGDGVLSVIDLCDR